MHNTCISFARLIRGEAEAENMREFRRENRSITRISFPYDFACHFTCCAVEGTLLKMMIIIITNQTTLWRNIVIRHRKRLIMH